MFQSYRMMHIVIVHIEWLRRSQRIKHKMDDNRMGSCRSCIYYMRISSDVGRWKITAKHRLYGDGGRNVINNIFFFATQIHEIHVRFAIMYL